MLLINGFPEVFFPFFGLLFCEKSLLPSDKAGPSSFNGINWYSEKMMEKLVKSFYLIFHVINVFRASYALKSGLLSTLGLSHTAFGMYWNVRVKKRETEVDDWTTLSQVQACWSKECVNIQSREVSFFPCSHLTGKETLGNLVVFFSRSNQTCCSYLLQTLVKFSPVTSLPTNFVIVPFFFRN